MEELAVIQTRSCSSAESLCTKGLAGTKRNFSSVLAVPTLVVCPVVRVFRKIRAALICRRKRKKNLSSLTKLTRTNALSESRPLQPERPNLGVALIGGGPCVAEDWQSADHLAAGRAGDPPRPRAFNPNGRDGPFQARQGLVPSLPARNIGWPR